MPIPAAISPAIQSPVIDRFIPSQLAGEFSPTYTAMLMAMYGSSLIDLRLLAETSGSNAADSSPKAHPSGTYTGTVLNSSQFVDVSPVGLWGGALTDKCNIYSSNLNTDFNGQELTIGMWLRPSSAGVWTDGVNRYVANLFVDANNQVGISKPVASNVWLFQYVAGGTTKSNQISITPFTNWFHVLLTVSLQRNAFVSYVNGIFAGVMTGIGTWAGALLSTRCIIGNFSTTNSNAWSGYIHAAYIANRFTTPEEAKQIGDLSALVGLSF